MKYLTPLTMILLIGCSTTNFVVSDELVGLCKTCESTKKVEVAPVDSMPTPAPLPKQSQNLPPQLQQQGLTQSKKQVLCGPSAAVFKSVKSYEETPYILWLDPNLKTNVMLFMNKEKDTLTLIENPNSTVSCVLSSGKNIHIELNTKSKIFDVNKEKSTHILEIKQKGD